MSFGIWCIAIGGVAWLAYYGLKGVFVDSSDEKNPFRLLMVGVGYAGLVVGAYGVVLVVIQALQPVP